MLTQQNGKEIYGQHLGPTRRNILFPVSRPTHFFFKKGKKKKKKKGGVVFRWLVAATPFFLQRLYLLRKKDGRGLVIVRRPTDLQLRETVGIPETSISSGWPSPHDTINNFHNFIPNLKSSYDCSKLYCNDDMA